MHCVHVCLLLVVQTCDWSSFPFLSSWDGDCMQPCDAESPARVENVLLWLQAADPPPPWMAKAELCLDSSGEAECRMFQVRENNKEMRQSIARCAASGFPLI